MEKLNIEILKQEFLTLRVTISFEEFLKLKGCKNIYQIINNKSKFALIERK